MAVRDNGDVLLRPREEPAHECFRTVAAGPLAIRVFFLQPHQVHVGLELTEVHKRIQFLEFSAGRSSIAGEVCHTLPAQLCGKELRRSILVGGPEKCGTS